MRINDYFDKVVVINLDRRRDRMEKVDSQLKELGVQYERFSAVDAQAEGDKFMELLPSDWDIFYLGAVLLNSEHCNEVMVRAMDTSSLHAYCINPKFKDRALEQARSYPEHIDVAYRLIHRQCRAYAALPTLVKQYPSYSDITLQDVDYLSWYK